ncbi:MAG TPA: DUF523 domain-containing protein [Spirochaetota bacterium]|nr:DUF523 domain-containing protein [Spirochaetota bacterium]HPF06621.1 DUF523 domain-containing protein [Spirochaetota bacterium]HPJ43124.1 DUF523 domain-containing protein [Spirochaetota bacterium]HPR37844.1 DUF523 domain-containing protein [Spirochaetota bacterium]HRX47516.1 DUF523 domain-containing protein [Spirochaetota bacterium]
MKKPEYLVSACLAGFPCRYNGTPFPVENIIQLVKSGDAIPFCPEQLGGLPTPRSQCEICVSGDSKKVLTIEGFDCTEQFLKGAEASLELAEKSGIKKAVLKSRSPSCGYGEIYDGTFSGAKTEGNGITADLLIKNGITIYTELTFNNDKN